MSLVDRVRSAMRLSAPAALTVAPTAPAITAAAAPAQTRSPRGGIGVVSSGGRKFETRRSSMLLRRFSEQNVWARVAINRRKREIAKAPWSIVRIDNTKASPKKNVVKEAFELFNFVNDTKISLSWLLNMIVEDILVLDAGTVEIERTASGRVAALWPLDGATIAPSNAWDGSDQKAPRYEEWRNGRVVAQYKNDDLVYMMANPRTNSVIGLSPLEVLIDTIEADLYGEDMEYRLMRKTAPAGMLYLGSAPDAEQVDEFRELWAMDIAGQDNVAILGGGANIDETGKVVAGSAPTWTPFTRSAAEEQRREYMKWLATKVAAAFEMDLLAFNLSESVHRSVGANMQSKTDDGLIALADTIADYITREIIWQIDPTHKHGFRFMNLTKRDAKSDSDIDRTYMSIGVTTPNEIRARMGLDPVEWGNRPWPAEVAKAIDPAQEGEGEAPGGTGSGSPPKDPDKADDDDSNEDDSSDA